MSELTAIDILINPDDTMLEFAKGWNASLRQSVPSGFELDATHIPHITVLQRYVRTADLEAFYDAIGKVIEKANVKAFGFKAVKLAHLPLATMPEIGLGGLVVVPPPELLDFQDHLIDAVLPYTESGGTTAAYATTPNDPDINQDTLNYIENYVPQHSGKNYVAHVTVGLAKLDDLTALEARPFEPLTFYPAGMAVFHLGNNGTAQTKLHSWRI